MPRADSRSPQADSGSVAGSTTTDRTPSRELLRRARFAEHQALERLIARHLPRLSRWARGRLPRWARGVADTTDVVQDVLLHTLKNLHGFDPARADALQAYLRRAVDNRIRDEYRRVMRRPTPVALDEVEVASPSGSSPFDAAVAGETAERYAASWRQLAPAEREAIVARLHLGYSYEQIALLLGKRTPDAARMAVTRALVHLAEHMDRGT